MQIWAASFGDGMTDWDGDFSFGDELIAVVKWENATATATLWINLALRNQIQPVHLIGVRSVVVQHWTVCAIPR